MNLSETKFENDRSIFACRQPIQTISLKFGGVGTAYARADSDLPGQIEDLPGQICEGGAEAILLDAVIIIR